LLRNGVAEEEDIPEPMPDDRKERKKHKKHKKEAKKSKKKNIEAAQEEVNDGDGTQDMVCVNFAFFCLGGSYITSFCFSVIGQTSYRCLPILCVTTFLFFNGAAIYFLAFSNLV